MTIPVNLPIIALEGFYQEMDFGERTTETKTYPGVTIPGYGVRALLPSGGKVSFYPYAGLANYTVDRAAGGSESSIGFQGGLGLGFRVNRFQFYARAQWDYASGDVDHNAGRLLGGLTLTVFGQN